MALVAWLGVYYGVNTLLVVHFVRFLFVLRFTAGFVVLLPA